MIIQTRYRDIPWEEARKCLHGGNEWRAEWERCRGKPISIQVPETTAGAALCEGPFFIVPGYQWEGRKVAVCPHIVEIGD
jgi:hypothetical protein